MTMRRPTFHLAALAAIAVLLLAGCGPRTPDALVASAKEYLAKGDRNAAVVQLKSALQQKPDYAEARFLLGKSLLETGDVLGAEKELQRAAELQYPSDQVAPPLARAMLLRGAGKQVIDQFGKAELNSPQSKAELQTTLGQAFLGAGNVDGARNAFAAAQAAVPGYPPAMLGDARIKVIDNDVPGASALVDAAIAKAPNLLDGWQFRGDLLAAQGRSNDSLAAYRKALEIRPGFLPAQARIVMTYLEEGKNAEAATELEAMKKLAPKHPQTFYLEALLAYRQKKFSEAREAVQQQLRAWPDNVPGLILSASIESQLGGYAQAEASLQKVLQRYPQHKFARMMLVYTYSRSGQPARALDALRPLLAGGNEDSNVQALAGEVLIQNGDATQAARYFARAAALDPQNLNKRRALAMSRLAAGDTDQGFHDLQDVAAADTGIRADLALIAVSMNSRKFDAALDAIAALEKKQPDKALPHNLRGGVLVAKGDIAGARKSFERAAAIDPSDFTAASSLAKLDLAQKKPDDAKKRYDALLAKNPKNAQALLALADLHAQAGGKPDEVVSLIGQAVSAEPTSSAPRLALISYYMRTQQPTKAVAAAQDALA
ncbi:MAG TPA: XrtA/PEP-CTERM system TPR-repeat protein PrsT, partial [Casimicrobiaceae bacterium]|nr:XrtA/PEP-CTERM system TPR-repeat protein PrsT [Casimicrobiaceae bacterium]